MLRSTAAAATSWQSMFGNESVRATKKKQKSRIQSSDRTTHTIHDRRAAANDSDRDKRKRKKKKKKKSNIIDNDTKCEYG